jgi:hypothetical protein
VFQWSEANNKNLSTFLWISFSLSSGHFISIIHSVWVGKVQKITLAKHYDIPWKFVLRKSSRRLENMELSLLLLYYFSYLAYNILNEMSIRDTLKYS